MNGIELAQAYYDDVVSRALARLGVAHAAGRLGSGSDVLGFDDDTSQDHDWGLRLNVLVDAADVDGLHERLDPLLPATYRGHPSRFATTWDERVVHRVQIDTVSSFVTSRLGVDVNAGARGGGCDSGGGGGGDSGGGGGGDSGGGGLTNVDWLALTAQSVLEVTAGPIFHDDAGDITRVRAALEWYPDDVWRYVLASGWARLAEEMALHARAARRDDDAGSRIIAARLARDLGHMRFLVARRWAPYPKWFGTSLRALDADFTDVVTRVLDPDYRAREHGLVTAAAALASWQRVHGLPTPDVVVEPFYARPFQNVRREPADVLRASITDPWLRSLPLVGSVEQWSDSVGLLAWPERRAKLRAFYAALA